jgi:ATP-dependent protease HslVU (ClpYQ) ATPase subunit
MGRTDNPKLYQKKIRSPETALSENRNMDLTRLSEESKQSLLKHYEALLKLEEAQHKGETAKEFMPTPAPTG